MKKYNLGDEDFELGVKVQAEAEVKKQHADDTDWADFHGLNIQNKKMNH